MLLLALGKRAKWEASIEWTARKYQEWAGARFAYGHLLLSQGSADSGFEELRAAVLMSKERKRITYQEHLCGHLAYYLQFDEAERELEYLRELDPKAAARMEESFEGYREHTNHPDRRIFLDRPQ